MENQKTNIRVLLSDKAEFVLDNILKSFGLEEKNVIVDRIIKNFVRENLSEKDLINYLEKDLVLPHQTAVNVAKELLGKLVPLLEKYPEEKFNDPIFREQISQKLFESEKTENKPGSTNVFSKIKTPIGITEALEKPKPEMLEEKIIESPQSEEVITPTPKRKSRLPQNPIYEDTQPKQPKRKNTGPDKYREPI